MKRSLSVSRFIPALSLSVLVLSGSHAERNRTPSERPTAACSGWCAMALAKPFPDRPLLETRLIVTDDTGLVPDHRLVTWVLEMAGDR